MFAPSDQLGQGEPLRFLKNALFCYVTGFSESLPARKLSFLRASRTSTVQFSSVAQSCPTPCNPMDCCGGSKSSFIKRALSLTPSSGPSQSGDCPRSESLLWLWPSPQISSESFQYSAAHPTLHHPLEEVLGQLCKGCTQPRVGSERERWLWRKNLGSVQSFERDIGYRAPRSSDTGAVMADSTKLATTDFSQPCECPLFLPSKRRNSESVIPSSWIWVGLVTCLGQQNSAEALLYGFWARALRGLVASVLVPSNTTARLRARAILLARQAEWRTEPPQPIAGTDCQRHEWGRLGCPRPNQSPSWVWSHEWLQPMWNRRTTHWAKPTHQLWEKVSCFMALSFRCFSGSSR